MRQCKELQTHSGKIPKPKFTKRDYDLTIEEKRWLRLIVHQLFLQTIFFGRPHIPFFMKNQLSRQYICGCTHALQATVCQPAVFTVSALVLWRQTESELSSLPNFLTGRTHSCLLLMSSVFHKSVESTEDKIGTGNRLSVSSISWQLKRYLTGPGW